MSAQFALGDGPKGKRPLLNNNFTFLAGFLDQSWCAHARPLRLRCASHPSEATLPPAPALPARPDLRPDCRPHAHQQVAGRTVHGAH